MIRLKITSVAYFFMFLFCVLDEFGRATISPSDKKGKQPTVSATDGKVSYFWEELVVCGGVSRKFCYWDC